MNQKNLSELSDPELLQEAKKLRSASILNAVLIGFLIGIIVYSIAVSSIGLFTLIPLFLAYKLINKKPGYDAQELKNLLHQRKLK